MDLKPTHRLDQGVYDKGQHVKRVHQPGSIPRMPIGVPSINQTRRTQRIEMNGDHAENGSERHLGDLQVNGSKMKDNRSYSINSFTNPKIRQTVNEVQMHKNFDNGGEIGYDDVGKGDVKDHEEYEDNTNRAEANFHHPSTQSYESGYRNNQYAGMKSHQRPMDEDEDEEEEDDILQPSLGPSGTFGKPRGQVHIDDSNDGFKLPSQQSLTKDRIKKLLTESSKNSNQTNLVIGGPASTVIKHTSAGSQKKIGSSSKRSISQSKKSSMINGTPVIGVNLSSTRKRSSVSSSKNTSNIKIKDERSLKPKNSGLVMKQKDFGAFPHSSPQVNDIYNHLKHKEEEPTTTSRNGQIGIHQGKRFFQPPDLFDQRATAEFGISATRKDAKASHRSNHISSAANDDYDSNNQDARSEMRESKGYYEIEMQRLKKKRETSSAKSTRSVRTSKSAASKIGAQIINLNRPDMMIFNRMNPSSRNSVTSASKISNHHIEKLYRHAFAKKEIQEKIKQEIDRQKEIEEDRSCSFRPMINAKSRKMNMPIDYSMNTFKSFMKGRPLSSDSRQSDSKSQKSDRPLSIKSDIGPSGHSSSKVSSQPLVLTIRKSDIEQEIAELQKTNLHQMFFKKKGASKLAANTTQEQLSVQPQRQPVKPSLKTFGKFSATEAGNQPIRADPNVFNEIAKIMRENDAMASIGVGIGNRGSSRVSATSEEDQAYSGPRLKTLD